MAVATQREGLWGAGAVRNARVLGGFLTRWSVIESRHSLFTRSWFLVYWAMIADLHDPRFSEADFQTIHEMEQHGRIEEAARAHGMTPAKWTALINDTISGLSTEDNIPFEHWNI